MDLTFTVVHAGFTGTEVLEDLTFTLVQRDGRIQLGWITFLTCWPVVPHQVKLPDAEAPFRSTELGTID